MVVVGLAFATYVVAQTFNAPTVDQGISELEILESGGTGVTVIVPAVIETNESEEPEIEKIDSDGDGMSDWFEENYMHTDPKVANDRYLLYVDADPTLNKNRIEKFIREYKFAAENTMIIENATFSDFKEAVDKTAEKADENVYVQINGHGAGPHRKYEVIETKTRDWGDGTTREIATKIRVKKEWIEIEPFMVFAGYERITYREIGEILDKIKCQKMLVSYSSCAGNTGVEPLNETLNRNPEYPRVIMGATEIDSGIGKSGTRDGNTIFIEEFLYQEINNTYLSMKEYCQYDRDNYDDILEQELAKIQESIEKGRILDRSKDIPNIEVAMTKMADPYDIAETFYFGEAKVKDLYKPQGN